jgi:prepilin-type N-terminal cleavage/methylation domain-containing protein
MRKGFTLVEMSVVFVIIALLMAGIMLAQSLVRSSRVQTIVSDVAGYQNAVSQFRQKYGELPGDMMDAYTYWGTNPNCSTAGGTGTGTQTCNGNGDGEITLSGSAPYEQFLVWQHLANGGFITGQYTGTSASATSGQYYCSPGLNCPGGKVNPVQAYFMVYSTVTFGALAATSYWTQLPGHYLIVGAAGSTGAYPGFPLLTTAEALALDSKVDDGLPGQGIWKSFVAVSTLYSPNNCVVTSNLTSGGVTSSLNSTPPSDGSIASAAISAYNTAYVSNVDCAFEILLHF